MEDKQSSSGGTHVPGTAKGEEKGTEGEPGRHEGGTSHADRPTGTSTARSATSVNPDFEEPISPDMPNMPPP